MPGAASTRPIAVFGAATLDYEGLPPGFGDRRRREYADRVSELEHDLQIAGRRARRVDVVDLGIVGGDEDAASVAESIARVQPAAIVAVPLIAARAGMMLAALGDCRAPVVVHAPADHATYPDDLTAQQAVLGSGPVGGFALGNVLARRRQPFLAVAASTLRARELTWLRAAWSAADWPNRRFASIAGEFPGMIDCHLDADRLQRDLGCSVAPVTLSSRRDGDADPAAASSDLRDAVLACTSGFDGVVIHCFGDEVRGADGFGVTACAAVSDLASSGVPTACMGDLPTLVAAAVANDLTGSAHYTEVDAADDDRRAILLTNGGELDRRLAAESASVVENQFFSGALGRGTAWRGRLRPGPASLVGFTPVGDGWRLITADGRITDDELSGFPVPHGFFEPVSQPAAPVWSQLVEAGAPHHMAVGAEHIGQAAGLWSDVLGVEHIHIG